MIAYTRNMGVLPLSLADKEGLDVKKAMEIRPQMSIGLFFDHVLKHCKNESRERLCFDQSNSWTFTESDDITEVLRLLKGLKIDTNHKTRAAENYVSYMKKKKDVQDEFKVYTNQTVLLPIKEMYAKYPSKYLDWLPMINNQLLRDSHLKLDDEILIYNPQLWEELHKLFAEFEEE